MALAAAPDLPGFHALSQLGAGPSSCIFSAQSQELGRWVALTVYSSPASAGRSGPSTDEFRRGFELTRRLGAHPHAVTLLDWGVAPDGRPYIVTEFYEHGTFETRVSGNQPLPVDKTVRIGIQVAGALETAHRGGVIHGGVHPSRLLADSDDEPSLADIGLVPLVDRSGPDALLGPINYHAPPEVLEGDALSAATDVYSLASTLHTLLTCHPPYHTETGDTAATLLLRVLRREHTPLTRPDAPPALREALRAALHPDPRQRPANVLAFAQSLQAVQQELGVPQTHPVLLDVAQQLAGGEARSNGPAPLPPLPAPTPPPGPSRAGAAGAPPWARPPANPEAAPTTAPTAPARPQPEPPEARSAPPSSLPPAPPVDKAFVPFPLPTNGEDPAVGQAASAPDTVSPAGQPTVAPPSLSASAEPAASPADRTGRTGPASTAATPADMGQHSAELPVPDARTRLIARGPKALPVVVLGAIVAALVAAATWMVISGSDPSDATSDNEQTEDQPVD